MSDIDQLVVFRVEDRRFAVSLEAAQRTERAVEVTPLPGAPATVLGAINVHGTIVPVLNLRRKFGLPEREVDVTDHFLLAHTRKRTVALATDGVLEVIDRPREPSADNGDVSSDTSLEGTARELSDGLLLMHDLGTFLSLDEEKALTSALSTFVHEQSNTPLE